MIRNLFMSALVLLTVPGQITALAEEAFDPAVYETQAVFSLNGRDLAAQSAFVTLTDELFSGQTNALAIRFFTDALTLEQREDIINNDARQQTQKDQAVMVLFIDKDNKIWQVNLTYQVPGTTAVYTVAWKPEDLQKFSEYNFDGERLRLKSSGSYQDVNPDQSAVEMTWEVDLDLPVFNKLGS